jgi:NAD(P)-dependent dehydrogenase (short-subunit alcohol dehydrogenase family)
VDLIREAGRKAVALPGDLRSEEFCKKLVADAVRELVGLDILVNNAGRQQAVEAIADLTSESFDATFKTNVYAPFWLTKAALPHLEPGASIINTASEQAYDPSAHLLDYAQTKACNVAFTKALSKQVAAKGIRVNAVAPGPVWTPLQVSGGQPQDMLSDFGKKTSLKRAGQPAELAAIYVLLASQESSFATGQVYGASGGGGNP